MDPSSFYGSMLLAGGNRDSSGYPDKTFKNNNHDHNNNNNVYEQNQPKQATYSADSSGSAMGTINFTDYDDESGNYYLKNGRQQKSASNLEKKYINHENSIFKRIDSETPSRLPSAMPTEEEESLFEDDDYTHRGHSRVKRQIYHQSTYEGPCYGFPLEVNIKSRIKMDQLFPIHGNSQYKKCIKVG